MTTKTQAEGTKVNWKAVDKATEVSRTYLIRDNEGREFFKMYKPSEAQKIFKQRGWKGKLVGTLDKGRKKQDDSPRKNIRKNSYYDFMDYCRV